MTWMKAVTASAVLTGGLLAFSYIVEAVANALS